MNRAMSTIQTSPEYQQASLDFERALERCENTQLSSREQYRLRVDSGMAFINAAQAEIVRLRNAGEGERLISINSLGNET